MLNKRERSFLNTAVVYGWCIEIESWNGKAHWDGDYCLPVKVGPICEGLIEKGYMERVGTRLIRPTKKATDLKCYRCSNGKKIGDDEEIGCCPHCDGAGMILEDKAMRL